MPIAWYEEQARVITSISLPFFRNPVNNALTKLSSLPVVLWHHHTPGLA
jgi:hypothetical protein